MLKFLLALRIELKKLVHACTKNNLYQLNAYRGEELDR